MKRLLTIKEKQEILIKTLKEEQAKNSNGYAIFGVEREVALPLVKQGILHKDTYRFTGGATLTKKGKIMKTKTIGNYKLIQVGKIVKRFIDDKLKESVEFDYQKDADKCFVDSVKMLNLLNKTQK